MDKRYSVSIWGLRFFRIIKTNSLRKIELIKLLAERLPLFRTVKIIDWDENVNDVIYYKRRGS